MVVRSPGLPTFVYSFLWFPPPLAPPGPPLDSCLFPVFFPRAVLSVYFLCWRARFFVFPLFLLCGACDTTPVSLSHFFKIPFSPKDAFLNLPLFYKKILIAKVSTAPFPRVDRASKIPSRNSPYPAKIMRGSDSFFSFCPPRPPPLHTNKLVL